MLLVISHDHHAAMSSTQFNSTNPTTPHSPVADDLSDTASMLDERALADGRSGAGKNASSKKASKRNASGKSAVKRRALLPQPSQTVEEAIAAGVPLKKLDELLRTWSKYNLQQAQLKAKAEAEALAKSIEDRRRNVADELLKVADSLGISVSEARKMFASACSEHGGKKR